MLTAAFIIGALFAAIIAQHFYLRSRLVESKRIESDLRSSERKFSGILSIAADAIITVDSSTRIVHFNRGAEEIFGHTAADAIGRHLAFLLPVRFRGAHDRSMEMFAQSPATARRMGERREIFGLRANGTEFPAEASISKLVESDGILYTVVLRDITRQTNAEADERFLANAASVLGSNLSVGVTLQAVADLPVPHLADACIIDLVTQQNQFRRITSLRNDDRISAAVRGLVSVPLTVESPSPVIDVIRRKKSLAIDIVDGDWLDANADPEAIPAWSKLGTHSQLILPLEVAGDPIGALTLIRIGARPFDESREALADKYGKLAVAALANAQLYNTAQQANRARDEVLGVVSHDLRNPINAIAMCARSLAEDSNQDKRARDNLIETIADSATWMNRLIGDLLDVASIERGQLALELRQQEPTQLMLQTLHMFEMEAGENGIALEGKFPTNLPLVVMDGARIVQVLGNLLRNALNFTPQGGRVVLSVEAREDDLLFSVSDTGPGIAPENVAHIFNRYWQSSDAARARGSGLGLSIARAIVEAHHGQIWVETELKVGTRFYFSIPSGLAET